MANLNPDTTGFKKIPKMGTEGTSRRPVQVKVSPSHYEA
jgi:hypothetical protein